MKKQKNSPRRRTFLRKLIVAVGTLPFVGNYAFGDNKGKVNQETIKMLTVDGELVEIDKSVWEKSKKSTPLNNSQLLKWLNSEKN